MVFAFPYAFLKDSFNVSTNKQIIIMDFSDRLFYDIPATIKPYLNDVYVDSLGNVIAHKPGVGKRVMLIAHNDVVRLMVTYVDERGFLYVKPAGGVDVSLLPARKVVIKHNGKEYIGIIGKKPIHLLRDEQNSKIAFENLWIDIGARNQDEAQNFVSIGDYVYFEASYEKLPNGLIAGPYFDNHAGVYALLNVAEQLHDTDIPYDLYIVASNHEEIGLRGAAVAAYTIKPDVCICIDATHATDYPSMNIINEGDIKLGGGCVLAKGPNIFQELFDSLESIAKEQGIKYQLEVSPYPTGTDANVIQMSMDGIKTALISIPCRYMHTPYEICSQKDINATMEIIKRFLCR